MSIASNDCLNSDLMFSLSVFFGLFLSPSRQTSSWGRPSWKEIQPELELWRKRFVSSAPGGPQAGPSQTSARETHQGLCCSHHVQRCFLLLDVTTVNSEFHVLRETLQQ